MRIAITGSTGLLGRHLFFEILKQRQAGKLPENLKIFLLGRSNAAQSFAERMRKAFQEEGLSYLGLTADAPLTLFEAHVHALEADLDTEKLLLSPEEDLKKLQEKPLDFFFHLAALPDLRNSPKTAEKVQKFNVEGTKNTLALLQDIEVKEFSYIGTAYICGTQSGKITPDFQNPADSFRNPYERSKRDGERLVRAYSQETGQRCRYFRPSIVCGRLLEQPLGHTHKFDVFYEIFGFFFAEKVRQLGSLKAAMTQPVHIPLRAAFAPGTTANIVPVDYLAKLLWAISVDEEAKDTESFHLVHPENVKLRDFLAASSEALHITGIEAVTEKPEVLNLTEKLYYSRAGELLTGYLTSEPVEFDCELPQKIGQKIGLHCPPMSDENIKTLMQYAMQKGFGLDFERLAKRFAKLKKEA